MLWKCCTQYASKFGKLISGHRTGKGQFSFQSPKRAMPKNIQTSTQLYSFHMLARLCLKSFYLDFRGTWTEKSSCISYISKRQRKQIKLPVCIGSWGKQGIQENISTSASLTTLKPLTVWITTNCGKLLKEREYWTTLPIFWGTCM